MWPNPYFPADLVIFTEEILNGKLHFCVQWRAQLFKFISRRTTRKLQCNFILVFEYVCLSTLGLQHICLNNLHQYLSHTCFFLTKGGTRKNLRFWVFQSVILMRMINFLDARQPMNQIINWISIHSVSSKSLTRKFHEIYQFLKTAILRNGGIGSNPDLAVKFTLQT